MHVCPLEWRYGSSDMRSIFTISNIVRTYIEVEIALMAGLERAGIAPAHCIETLKRCAEGLEPHEIYRLEEVTGHDIASLAYILGERCGECGRYVHLGATSYDIVDTSWAILVRRALEVVMSKLGIILKTISKLAMEHRDTIMVGRTHGQHALPITLGFKLANYVYELSRSYERLCQARKRVVKSKFSGAVGTMAAWGEKGFEVEKGASEYLGMEPHTISTQVAPRDGFAELISTLAILASQLDRFALEVRELSRTEIGELYEAEERVGSSTMPHKRNPTLSERISGLAKILRSLVLASLENIPLMHERDLTNSSSERILIPHAFLTIDQMLEDTIRLLRVLRIDAEKMKENLMLTRGAIMSESIVIRLAEKGLPRQVAHKMLSEITKNLGNRSLADALITNTEISRYLSSEEIKEALDPRNYLGKYRELIDRAVDYMEKVLKECT